LVLEALQREDPQTAPKAYVLINRTVSNFKCIGLVDEPLDGVELIDEDYKRVAREWKLKRDGYQSVGGMAMEKKEQACRGFMMWPYDYVEMSQGNNPPTAIFRVNWQGMYCPQFRLA
jgi:hypothetical protein